MLRIQKYQVVESIEEAYDLLQKNRNNQIIAGMLWLKMQNRTIPVGVDLGKLALHQIEETDEAFVIGAMTSLRDIETHVALNKCCHNILHDSVKDIVGVQFRNMATIGGSVFSRFGFSDIICALLCLDCDVCLHKAGRISLATFLTMKYDRDILTHIIVKKHPYQCAFTCVRKSATDFSMLNVAVNKDSQHYYISVGATPKKAQLYKVDVCLHDEEVAQKIQQAVVCEGNMRASKEYREKLVGACTLKALQKLRGVKEC